MTRPLPLATSAAALLLLAVAWWLLWPTQLGGRTGYAVVVGTSMEPQLSRGDLALVRRRSSYEVGDAVLYRSAELDRNVLHRIVRSRGDRFVLKGDANDFLDGARPTEEQVVGELWLVLPGVGTVLEWLRRPAVAALVAAIAALLLAGGRGVARRRRLPGGPVTRQVRGSSGLAGPSGAGPHALLAGCLVFAAAGGLVALVAWTRAPDVHSSSRSAYVSSGTFSYVADVPRSPVYPDGRVETGEVAFTSIVRRLAVAFDYRFAGARPLVVAGTTRLDAIVDDGAGWSRSLRLAPERPFTGPEVRVRGPLDLERLTRVVGQMRALTGSGVSTFSVQVVPTVELHGSLGTDEVADTFAPALSFTLDPTGLRLDPPDDAADPLTPRQEGGAAGVRQARLGVGAAAVPVRTARLLSLTILALALLAAAAAALAPRRPLDPARTIERRHRSRIVRAEGTIPDGRWVADVPDLASLARIAEAYDRVTLRVADGGREVYAVDDGVAVYRYGAAPPADEAPTLVLAGRDR
jgi:signal peptidase I